MTLLKLITFFLTYFIVMDIVWSILAVMWSGSPYIYRTCDECGEEDRCGSFTILLWRTLTHRCDNNLI